MQRGAPVTEEQRSAYAHGLPGDPAMPGFGAALDRETMTRLVAGALLPGCTDCRPTRFRYRPGERLIVTYDAEVDGTRAILTGRIHPGRDSSARQRPNIPAIGMRLSVFPEDRRLPMLARYLEPQSSDLAALLQRAGISVAAGGTVAAHPLRYRPGLAATLRVDCPAHDGVQHAYLKATGEGDIVAELATARAVNALLTDRGRTVRLAEPLAVDAANSVMLYAHAPGSSLDEILLSQSSLDVPAGIAAATLHALHELPSDRLPPSMESLSRDRMAQKIASAQRFICWASADLAPLAGKVAERALALLASPLRAPTHSDMKPEHVFLGDDGSVQLIDSGSLCNGNPLLDLGALLVRVDLLAARSPADPARIARFKRTLTGAYFARAPQSWQADLDAAIAYAALLVATHLIQNLVPGWRDLAAARLSQALACLASQLPEVAA